MYWLSCSLTTKTFWSRDTKILRPEGVSYNAKLQSQQYNVVKWILCLWWPEAESETKAENRQQLPRNLWPASLEEKPCIRVTPRMSGEVRNNLTPDNGAREFWEIPAPAPQPREWRPGDIDWDQFRRSEMRRGGGGTREPLPPPPGHYLRKNNSRPR